MKKLYIIILFLLGLFAVPTVMQAQWPSHESVLSRHTWYKIGVTEEGVYALDPTTLQAMGVDLSSLNPSNVKLYGNVAGALPEANDTERFDDLTEIASAVEDGDDGSFDADDRILFYGQGPVNLDLHSLGYFSYNRNLYCDTVYYYLCVDDPTPGLRIEEQTSVATGADDTHVTTFPDVVYHESEELSPYNSGRTWYGDLITPQEGFREFTFDLPGLVTTMPLRICSSVLGRCTSLFPYSIRIGDNLIVDNYSISAYSSQGHEYGKAHQVNTLFYVDSEQITVRYQLGATTANPMLFIDYFIINFQRAIRLCGHGMAFRLIPSQMETPVSEVQIEGWTAQQRCWDVTNPLRPLRQQVTTAAGLGSFGMEGQEERHFYLFDPEGIKAIASAYHIDNQNLHALTETDFLIVTPRDFWAPAEALADFHREQDGMNCQVVDIQEIFNEFGTGTPDPTALRDFIRMVYLRSQGRLKYVLLLGKGSHDYRNLKGAGNNFVITYETREYAYREVASMCTDDYFALMDPDEGEDCLGMVDIGMGRLPITTEEQGFDMVEKIKHYADLSVSHGSWKNDHLFMADNNSHSYINYTEYLDQMLDTANHSVTSKKLYVDSYPLVSTVSGDRIPDAHDALMRYFDQGFGVMSYTGHGGVKSLTSEWVLSLSDIPALDNYDHLPLIHTATCEFSKFDDPNVVSAGEQMILHNHGGAIALLTSLRPTIAASNQQLSKSFQEHVYDQEDHQPLRFGDIYRLAKSDPNYYNAANLVYVFFGDPALRFLTPTHQVKTLTVNGNDAQHEGSLPASNLVTVEGTVLNATGQVDAAFNGVLDVRLYDKKASYVTLGSFDGPQPYAFFEKVLFEGKAPVTNGHFTVQLYIPTEISANPGPSRLSYYAYDSIRRVEANGVFDYLRLSPSQVVAGGQGPDIRLYWDQPEFVNGDVVSRNGTLVAELFDEQGVYHYNYSLGRDIVLKSNLPGCQNRVLNDLFQPAVDDYRKGRIELPLTDLPDGQYELTLKAWDTQDNASEAEMVFRVESNTLLAQVYNYPNPFDDETWFTFVNGDVSESLSVTIEVFDILGRRVALLAKETSSENGTVEPIRWDGRTNNGADLSAGVYVYRIQLTNSQGHVKTLTRRMVKK